MTESRGLHPIQTKILHHLLFLPAARFSDLNAPDISSDRFAFHLKKLTQHGLVEKIENRYQLTTFGKGFANQLRSFGEHSGFERHARVGVLVGCVRSNPDSKTQEFLLQQRLKHPFYGCHGFMASKIRWGETVLEAAARALKVEQNLTARLEVIGLKHKMDYAETKELLEDKYFFVVKGTNPQGTLTTEFEGGKNFWVTENEAQRLQNTYGGFLETIEMLKNTRFQFLENQFFIKNY